MQFSTALECVTDLLDDQIEDGENIIQPGGRVVAQKISDILKREGIKASEPSLDSEHGWELIAVKGKEKYWILVTDLGHEKLVQTKDISPLAFRLVGRAEKYFSFLQLLHRILSDDPKFISVEWWSPA